MQTNNVTEDKINHDQVCQCVQFVIYIHVLCTMLCLFCEQDLLNNAITLLATMDRVVKPIIGDGNCLFRALAYVLYGEEMFHDKMRELLANFISRNRTDMQPYIDGDIRDYVAKVKLTRVWGTAVELLAAASLFEIPVFTFIPREGGYHWLCYKPLTSNNLVYPTEESRPWRLNHMDHVELLNTYGCHYDCIMANDGGYLHDRPPLNNNVDFVSVL